MKIPPDGPGRDEAPPREDPRGIRPIEHELTMHLARAHELAQRARRANGAVQHEIERARAIVDQLSEQVTAALPEDLLE